MSDEDPGELADELGQRAGEMERRSGKLSREIDDVGDEWERKRADPSVPGAQTDHGTEESDETPHDAGEAAGNAPQGDSPGGSEDSDEDT